MQRIMRDYLFRPLSLRDIAIDYNKFLDLALFIWDRRGD